MSVSNILKALAAGTTVPDLCADFSTDALPFSGLREQGRLMDINAEQRTQLHRHSLDGAE